ncbi:MAG: hypothetical protein ACI9R3_004628 [Verrucomicrobiales bacterium]|jgi:hypothetical protein
MTAQSYRVFLCSASFQVALASASLGAEEQATSVDFDRDIRPIIAEKCTLCHGPNEKKGGLQLSGIEFARKKLKSGNIAIVPGDPDASELVARIHSSDPDEVMPPPDKAEPLTAAEKELVRKWIASGADWPKHWAYSKLEKPSVPEVSDQGWVENPIDGFVLEKLDEQSIAPSPEATPITLIRRLFYDLAGLPPTLAQVDLYETALERDREAGVAKLVDDLLASPHFGERWGRHWLDIARYADSDGYEKDNHRPDAWRYRDWVIDSINDDMPIDQFTIEQFSGDLLSESNPDHLLATAFNRQTLTNTEGGTDKEQWRVAAVMDRVETMGAAWMGLTLTCARCHTHKYDEITHHEYYQLFAYFNNGDESSAKIPRSKDEWAVFEAELAKHGGAISAAKEKRNTLRDTLKAELPEFEKRTRDLLAATANEPQMETVPVTIGDLSGPEGVTFERHDNGSITAGGENPGSANYTVSGTLEKGTYYGLVLEVLPVEDPAAHGPGRAGHGNFVLNHIEFSVNEYPLNPVFFSGAAADYSQDGWHVTGALDPESKPKQDGNGWAVGGQTGKAHQATFAFAQNIIVEEPTDFAVKLVQNYGDQHTIGKFRITALTTPTAIAVPEAIKSIVQSPESVRSPEQKEVLLAFYENFKVESALAKRELVAIEAKLPARPEMDVRIMSERTKDRRTTHVFRRGEFKQPTDQVEAGTLSVLPPIAHREGSSGDRLDLARWLVNGDNPLPPRVLANHLWANLFGEGIVTTVNDFGVRGARPSHRRLLDWLAAELVENGWSRKKLISTIVLSNAYRQSSNHRPELRDIDPKNRLLARQNRFRVEAEIVRDVALSVAGLLSPKIGGPSVFPPIPDGVSDLNYNSAFKWKVSAGDDRYRRGMYTYFKRTAPHPNLVTFDCPDSNVTCVQRTRSNTPLAALITLNNDTFTEAARSLALRVLGEKPDATDTERLGYAFRLCLSRLPDGAERAQLHLLLERSRRWYVEHPESATALVGDLPPGSSIEDVAGYTATVRVLINLDEFLTRN